MENSEGTQVIQRKFVENYMSWDDDNPATGFIYYFDKDEPQEYFEDNFHIHSADPSTGYKYVLRIGRDEWFSDNLLELEANLFDFIDPEVLFLVEDVPA